VTELAAHCGPHQFVYLDTAEATFLDVQPLVDAGVWLLDGIAPEVAEHYVRHLAGAASPSTLEFVGRLRADLRATSDVAAP
jgi:hypothetical protein